ncbi:MAG: ATP-grasp domain-containing protein [Methanobacterium sp.]
MKILILEYASASGINDPSICTEGYAMLEGLIDDFKSRNADYLLSYKVNFNSKNCNCIRIQEDLMDWLDNNIQDYEKCILIAPEEDLILFKLTELMEKKNVHVIGSSSKAVSVCSDKFEMYKTLKDHVNIIKTEKIYFNDIDGYKPSINCKKVIKPADGVSCSGVRIVESFKELKIAAESMHSSLPYFLVQEFVEGTPASVSMLSDGKEAIPLSLNLQHIRLEVNKISYNGGEVPFEHELSEDAQKIAKKAVESINGLKGYVGVDIILGDEVHLVEINPRLTTPYVALKNILNFNLGEAIFDSVYGVFPSKINFNGKISFYKKDNNLKINELSKN